jgi:hypothetical protein
VSIAPWKWASIVALLLSCGGEDDDVAQLRDEVEDLKDQVEEMESKESRTEENPEDPRLRRSELPSNVDAIKAAQLTYDASFDTYVEETSLHPGETAPQFTTGSDLDNLGWEADGTVRGAYKVVSTPQATLPKERDVEGEASSFTATKTLNIPMNTENEVY